MKRLLFTTVMMGSMAVSGLGAAQEPKTMPQNQMGMGQMPMGMMQSCPMMQDMMKGMKGMKGMMGGMKGPETAKPKAEPKPDAEDHSARHPAGETK